MLFFQIKRIISSEKWFNYIVTFLCFCLLKMPKIWIGWTTLNGEKKGLPSLVYNILSIHTIAQPIWKCSFLLKRWCKELAIASKDETARESSARMLKEKRHNAIILDVDWNEQLGYTGYTSKSLINNGSNANAR